ncbi:chorismate-binding protein [Pseudomonas sp. 273]|uniref:chorismate-binding protein n=1 Tax=Pseudomonas sp. 273 TaxID=75692 RepID=UPI0023D7F858|nr:chorismate-binding protein [Pseudomonas sp. 273]
MPARSPGALLRTAGHRGVAAPASPGAGATPADPVRGRLRAGVDILDLVAALHPTPAVGGLPREAALDYIRRHEGMDRGWYAAPVGWLDAAGDAEFCVALRSALLRGDRAHLFAGCGIVAASEPQAEYRETCLKLRTMQDALAPPVEAPQRRLP